MSRPDPHAAEYDYPVFDTRDFPHNPPPVPGQGPYHVGDLPRDFWSRREQPIPRDHRDPASRDGPPPSGQPAYYHTPTASLSSGQMNSIIAGTEVLRPANGVPNVAPRMYGMGAVVHGMGMGGGAGERDGWNPAGGMHGSATSGANPAGTGATMPPTGPNSLSSGGYVGGVTGNSHVNRPPQLVTSITSPQVQPASQQSLVLNRHHRASPPRPPHSFQPNPPPAFNERDRDTLRDAFLTRQFQQQTSGPTSGPVVNAQPASLPSPTNPSTPPRSTLWWGDLEPWMDEEYAKQVCNLMGWDPVSIKVPRPNPDPVTGRQANNPGYCFLTFPSHMHASSVLSQVNTTSANPVTMPNSTKPFTMNWASSVPTAPVPVPFSGPTISIPGAQNPQYPKEYSIFVGDLAPEVSNSDLVAVFRNPVLGLRNDREPRFIRPFLSCKSAKIMLDPVTGVSRGYGFVRFVTYRNILR